MGNGTFETAARLLATGATPLSGNGFKVDLLRYSVVWTLEQAAGPDAGIRPGTR